MNASLLKKPSAALPIAMSLAGLAVVLGHAALYGTAHEVDEGAAAHIWQILMVAQVPLICFFAAKWLPRVPRQTLSILTLQAGAALASFAAVFFLT